MSFANMGLHNLTQQGFDAVQFSLMGMSVVFGGLVIIALYIMLLPKLLQLTSGNFFKKKKPAAETTEQDNQDEKQKEILLAVATALHLYRNFPDENERITWKSHGDMESPWLVSGRMHGLSVRKQQNIWK